MAIFKSYPRRGVDDSPIRKANTMFKMLQYAGEENINEKQYVNDADAGPYAKRRRITPERISLSVVVRSSTPKATIKMIFGSAWENEVIMRYTSTVYMYNYRR